MYMDDILCFGKDPLSTIQELKWDYIPKGIGKPEYYLGCNIVELDDMWKGEHVTTAMSAETYIQNVTAKYKALFGGTLQEFKTPMDHEYHPELDQSPLLDAKSSSMY